MATEKSLCLYSSQVGHKKHKKFTKRRGKKASVYLEATLAPNRVPFGDVSLLFNSSRFEKRPKESRLFLGQHLEGHRHPHEHHLPIGHRRRQVRRGREQEREVDPANLT